MSEIMLCVHDETSQIKSLYTRSSRSSSLDAAWMAKIIAQPGIAFSSYLEINVEHLSFCQGVRKLDRREQKKLNSLVAQSHSFPFSRYLLEGKLSDTALAAEDTRAAVS